MKANAEYKENEMNLIEFRYKRKRSLKQVMGNRGVAQLARVSHCLCDGYGFKSRRSCNLNPVSSAGQERLPYKQEVGSSNLSPGILGNNLCLN